MSLQTLQTSGEEGRHRQLIADTLNQVIRGRANVSGTLTLDAGTTSTQFIDTSFESSMVPVLIATTANAAAALATTYLSARTKGAFTLTHANTGTTDRTFLYIRWG